MTFEERGYDKEIFSQRTPLELGKYKVHTKSDGPKLKNLSTSIKLQEFISPRVSLSKCLAILIFEIKSTVVGTMLYAAPNSMDVVIMY